MIVTSPISKMNAVEKFLIGDVPGFTLSDPSLVEHTGTNTESSTQTKLQLSNKRIIEVPANCGIMIELQNTGCCDDCQVLLHTAVTNQNYGHIHPHCHGPANMGDVRLLHGGGSGTAVFHGLSDTLGSIVMKHGGAKDASEVFSLITIRQELCQRSKLQEPILKNEAIAAAERMRRKIPEFVMVYISPYHLRDRDQELWSSLRGAYFNRPTTIGSIEEAYSMKPSGDRFDRFPSEGIRPSMQAISENTPASRRFRRSSRFSKRMTSYEKQLLQEKERGLKRRIQISVGHESESSPIPTSLRWNLSPSLVEITLHSNVLPLDGSNSTYIIEDGIDGLQSFTRCLRQEMANQQWKVTLAQKTIGGSNPENGAHVLTQGKLRRNVNPETNEMVNNPLLQKLVIEFCQVMEDLSTLTYPHERKGQRLDSILEEVIDLREKLNQANAQKVLDAQHMLENYDYTDPTVCVSKELDLYVGSAIHKNFDPLEGRLIKLREFASDVLFEVSSCHLSSIQSVGDMTEDEASAIMQANASVSESSIHSFFFAEQEKTPAQFLALLLQKEDAVYGAVEGSGASARIGIKRVFMDPPSERSALDEMEDRGWLDLLLHATSFSYDENICSLSRSAAMDCIWTCGLTDAGLHNTFVKQERGLELFDLGEPHLEPQPAFLTKFLMSFFHTLGMEESDNDGSSGWVQRFNIVKNADGEQLLELTDKTKEMIPYIHDSFVFTLNHLIENIFHSNEQVRSLLLKYVVLQLLSDSSFCIARWQEKGGGAERYGEKLKEPLEKWLWRSLWDQYIASYVYNNLLLPCEQSNPGHY